MREKALSPRQRAVFLAGWFLLWSFPALAEPEVGATLGFDSNVNRAVDGAQSDVQLGGYAAFLRAPDGESRYDWAATAMVEGAVSLDVTDLSYAALTAEPGFVFFPRWWLTVSVSPFVQGKAVKDTDQSAVSFGGKIRLREQIRTNLYSGQYYVYTDSRANEEVYSYTEHAVGIFFGVLWRKGAFTEIGYEFSHGDSFRTVNTTTPLPSGMGKGRRYSSAFGGEVVRDTVDRNAVSVSAGIDWTPSLAFQAGYAYARNEGDLGPFTSHSGYAGIAYRF
ncbi:MAG: hypothetical protein JSV28_07950 [Deltaproteobacteria bacterium]|nr:MAG: hypothetical protein JSV28_07950 [Deltaproteobacteria bacterium]